MNLLKVPWLSRAALWRAPPGKVGSGLATPDVQAGRIGVKRPRRDGKCCEPKSDQMCGRKDGICVYPDRGPEAPPFAEPPAIVKSLDSNLRAVLSCRSIVDSEHSTSTSRQPCFTKRIALEGTRGAPPPATGCPTRPRYTALNAWMPPASGPVEGGGSIPARTPSIPTLCGFGCRKGPAAHDAEQSSSGFPARSSDPGMAAPTATDSNLPVNPRSNLPLGTLSIAGGTRVVGFLRAIPLTLLPPQSPAAPRQAGLGLAKTRMR